MYHRDALERAEMLREWYDSDPEAEGVELPDVEGAIPQCLRGAVGSDRWMDGLADGVPDSQVARILMRYLKLRKVSRGAPRPRVSDEISDLLGECNPPLPALLVVFRKWDAIEASFDEESQGMLEVTPEPSLVLSMEPDSIESVRGAFRSLGAMCRTLQAAAELFDAPPNSGKGNSDEPLNPARQ